MIDRFLTCTTIWPRGRAAPGQPPARPPGGPERLHLPPPRLVPHVVSLHLPSRPLLLRLPPPTPRPPARATLGRPPAPPVARLVPAQPPRCCTRVIVVSVALPFLFSPCAINCIYSAQLVDKNLVGIRSDATYQIKPWKRN